MKILITGGHFSPAYAVMQEFPADVDLVYVGRKYSLEGDSAISLEYRIMHEKGIPFREIQPGRLHRVISRYRPQTIMGILRGFWQADGILRGEKPDVIVSFGGYVAIPICIVGFLRRIPILLHEQTFEAGLANQLLSRVATKVCLSWNSAASFFPKEKSVLTGNPNFSSLFAVHPTRKKHPFTILVTGGNSGAHTINILIEENLEEILKLAILVHQTGDAQQFKDYDRLLAKKKTLPQPLQEKYILEKFFPPEQLHQREADANLVITRAGANTVGELLILHKPSLVIPIPATQRDEQGKNAAFLVESGLGVRLDQETTTPRQFLDTLRAMIKNINHYHCYETFEKDVQIHQQAARAVARLAQEIAKRT